MAHGYSLRLDRTRQQLDADFDALTAEGYGIETLVSYMMGGKVLYAAHFSKRPNNVRSESSRATRNATHNMMLTTQQFI